MSESLQSFKNSIKGTIKVPGEEGYDLSRWAPNSEMKSQIIVSPEQVEDISLAIKFAKAEQLPIAVRGGGHNTSTAASTSGLLIDMRSMNKIRVDEQKQLAYVEAGTKTHQIEDETAKYGLAAVLGICSQVSVAALNLHGGIGYSMANYGLALDNLVSATVVLANGDIVGASETENPDLFWGIRGGGSNFGIVAELCIKLHPQRPDVLTIQYAYDVSKLPQIVDALNQWREVRTNREALQMVFSLGPDGKPYVTIAGMCNSTEEDGRAAFKPFLDIGPAVAVNQQIPYNTVCRLTDLMSSFPANKALVGTHIDLLDLPQAQKAYDAVIELTKKAPFSLVMYEFYNYQTVAKVPLEATAFSQRHDFTIVGCCVGWTDEEFTPHVRDVLFELKRIVSGSSSQAAQDSLGYANYADAYATLNETDEYARKLFGANYPRLQEVKKKYDPEMVFNKWFAIRPAA